MALANAGGASILQRPPRFVRVSVVPVVPLNADVISTGGIRKARPHILLIAGRGFNLFDDHSM